MALHKLLNNFTGGEISSQLDARIDLQKYDTSCRRLENMRVHPQGGVSFRAGTKYIAPAKFSDRPFRLIPFIFNTSIGYILELGENYIRFYREGAPITATAPAWVAPHAYSVNDFVTTGGTIYRCIVANLSGIFADDLAAGKWTAQSAYEILSDFTSGEVFDVQFKQINDVMYMVHPNHPVTKLSRLSNNSWRKENVAWTYPTLLDENVDDTRSLLLDDLTGVVAWLTLTPYVVGDERTESGKLYRCSTAHTSGTFATDLAAGKWVEFHTLDSSFDFFAAGHVGSYFELRNLRTATSAQLDLSGSSGTANSTAMQVVGDWQVVTTERWYGVLKLQRSLDDGVTWSTIREFVSKSDRNVAASGTQASPGIGKPVPQLRLRYTATADPYGSPDPWVGTPPTTYVKATGKLEVSEAYQAALVVVSSVANARHAEVSLFIEGRKNEATTTWSEGAWSTYRGYPRTVGLFEQRLFFAGTTTNPNTLWGSATADFENFQFGELDDAAVAYQLASAQQNPIEWLESLTRLHAATTGGEHIIDSGNGEEPLTPNNVVVRDPSSYGSESMQGVKVENAILFLQRQGRRIRELRDFSPSTNANENVAADLTLLAEHLTDVGIYQLAYARLPDPYLYAVMGNGALGVMCYNREQNINGWSRYVTRGRFETVAAVPSSPSDIVYVGVSRTIGGQTMRFVEVFTAETDVKILANYADASVVYAGAPATNITGLGHLEGEMVSVLADGNVVGDTFRGAGLVVSGGQITLPHEAGFVSVGLFYKGQITPQKIDAMLASGTSQGRKRRISELCLRFKDTLGGVLYGNSSTNSIENNAQATELDFRSTYDSMDTSPPLFSGDMVVPWEGGADTEASIQITQVQPLPMTVLGIFAKLEFFGE